MVGEYLDLTSGPREAGPTPPVVNAGGGEETRAFLGVHFLCCDVYARIYVNHERTAYQGHCPRCSRPVIAKIGLGGSDARFFQAG